MSPETICALRDGEIDRLLQMLWLLAGQWLKQGGGDLLFRNAVSSSQIAGSESAKAAFLAAGCDLYDLLAQVPQAREALLCLSTERISTRSKREGGVDA